jgi:hypothetical protein
MLSYMVTGWGHNLPMHFTANKNQNMRFKQVTGFWGYVTGSLAGLEDKILILSYPN